MNNYILLSLLVILIISCESNKPENIQISVKEHQYFDYDYVSRISKLPPFGVNNNNKNLDSIDIYNFGGDDSIRQEIIELIIDDAINSPIYENADSLADLFGSPAWDKGLVCPTCDIATVYFPTIEVGIDSIQGLLVATKSNSGTTFTFLTESEIRSSAPRENWVLAFVNLENILFGHSTVDPSMVIPNYQKKNLTKQNDGLKCETPYAIVASQVGNCWITFAIINCEHSNFDISCSNGGGSGNSGSGTVPPNGNSTPSSGGIVFEGGSSGGGGSGSNWGDGVDAYNNSFDQFNWHPSPSHFENILNCPPGSFHAPGNGIKALILKDWGAPCNNPDIHLDTNDNIILVCPNGAGSNDTGFSIYNYSCD